MSDGGKSKDAKAPSNKTRVKIDPGKTDDKAKRPPAVTTEDDDVEDGDIATPKRDRDDEQQGL